MSYSNKINLIINETNTNERIKKCCFIYATIKSKTEDFIETRDYYLLKNVCWREDREIEPNDETNYFQNIINNLSLNIHNKYNKLNFTNTKLKQLLYNLSFEENINLRQELYNNYSIKKETKTKKEYSKKQLIDCIENFEIYTIHNKKLKNNTYETLLTQKNKLYSSKFLKKI